MRKSCKNCGLITLVALESWGIASGLTPLICSKCDYKNPADIVVEKVANNLDFTSPSSVYISGSVASVFTTDNGLNRSRLL